MEHKPDDNMVCKGAFWSANMFLRDRLIPNLFWSDEYSSIDGYQEFLKMLDRHHDVIGTHRSKSIAMPVLRLDYKGCVIILRYNFHDYEVAIINGKDVDLPMKGLFCSKETSFFYQGFPDEFQLTERYEDNHSKFMANIHDDYSCYTFFFLLRRELDRVNK